MFIIPGKSFSLFVSVLKQMSYLSFVRNEIKTTIFQNLRQKNSKLNISYNQTAAINRKFT